MQTACSLGVWQFPAGNALRAISRESLFSSASCREGKAHLVSESKACTRYVPNANEVCWPKNGNGNYVSRKIG